MADQGKIARRKAPQESGIGDRHFQGKKASERQGDLFFRQVIEMRLERKAPQRCLVEAVAQVGGAGKGQGMVFHPGEHFIDLADLPVAHGMAAVAEQGIGFIEDQKGFLVQRLLKGGGNGFFRLADIGIHQVRGPF